MFVLLFTRLALQGIVYYTFSLYYRAVISLPCVKGGGSRKRVGGIVKNKILSKNNPSVTFGDSSLYTREPFFMFIYALSIFLTSTAFVDTKAKLRTRRDKQSFLFDRNPNFTIIIRIAHISFAICLNIHFIGRLVARCREKLRDNLVP